MCQLRALNYNLLEKKRRLQRRRDRCASLCHSSKFLDDNKPKALNQKRHLQVNLHSFTLILANVSVVEFERTYLSSEREKENLCVVFTYSIKRATTAKKCTDKCNARAKLLFCQPKPIAFLPFLLPSPSTLLIKFPIVVIQKCFFHSQGTSHFSSLFTNKHIKNVDDFQAS